MIAARRSGGTWLDGLFVRRLVTLNAPAVWLARPQRQHDKPEKVLGSMAKFLAGGNDNLRVLLIKDPNRFLFARCLFVRPPRPKNRRYSVSA
jgi:hypothetical protein